MKSLMHALLLLCFLGSAFVFSQWDTYPTYDEYLDMMSKFETDYPNLCKIVEFGQSVDGRKLLAAKVTDNVNVEEKEPQFLYFSTIHGDETLGYVLMLRLIDYLLSNYGNDILATRLVDSIEIWINPLANPDGTYQNDNSTVFNARRFNANGKDLCRNYPVLPGTSTTQPPEEETEVTMELVTNNNFVMAASFHGGIETAIYPWCMWDREHPDKLWFESVCKGYIDTAGYFPYQPRCCYDPLGYQTPGTPLDYLNYYEHCRKIRLEISSAKLVSEERLNDYWEWNYRSILNYISQVLYGIRGTVTDTTTGLPIGQVKVFIEDHDTDSSFVRSHSPHGDYYRPIYAGTYDVTFSCPGYHSKTFENVHVDNNRATILNVELSDIPLNITSKINSFSGISIDIRKNVILIKSDFPLGNNLKIEIYDLMGKKVRELPASAEISLKDMNGIYIVRLSGKNINRQFKVMVTR